MDVNTNGTNENVVLGTNSETQLYFLWSKLANKHLYTETWAFKLEETINLNRLFEGIKFVVSMSPELQVNFSMEDGVLKKIQRNNKISIFFQERQSDPIENFIEKLKEYSFDLENEPLIQFYLWSNKANEKYLLINSHHIVTDAWTKNLLVDRIMNQYFEDGKTQEIIKSTSEKKDVSLEKINKFRDYCQSLETIASKINPYHSHQELHTGFVENVKLDQAFIDNVMQFCKENKISIFSFYLGCFYSFVCTYSGEKDLRIGIPFANRQSAEEQQVLGYFVNMLPFSLKQEKNKLVNNQMDYFRNIQRRIFQIAAFQEIPFSEVVQELKLDSSFFNVVFSYQESQAFEGIEEELNISQLGAKFELTVNFKKNQDDVFCELEFSDEVWSKEEAHYFTESFQYWLEQSLSTELAKLMIRPFPSKNQKLLSNLKKDREPVANIFEAFLKVKRKSENKTAIIYQGEHFTYRQIYHKIINFSKALDQLELNEMDIISLQLKRSPDSIALILALAKKGIPYVHLSQYYPLERMAYILSDSETQLLITDDEEGQFLEQIQVPVQTINQLLHMGESASIIYDDLEVNESKLFTLIYTSGTTGNPKGVKISHKNILNFSSNFQEMGFSETDIFSQASSFTFDAHFFELWFPLLNGAGINIISEPVTDDKNWHFTNESDKPTVSFLTTSLFNTFVESGVIANFSGVSRIFIGGESASAKYISKAQKMLDNVTIYNGYGPTENTTFATIYPIPNNVAGKICLGVPLNNVIIGILGSAGQLLPAECLGEVVIAGDSLMEGYFKQPALTDEKLIVLDTELGIQTFYKTGDIGRIGTDDHLYYKCRKDRQVKIRGFRVELAEIEEKVLQIEGIHKCIISFQKNELARKLTLYYEGDCQKEDLRIELNQHLPAYMLPNEIVQVAQIKLTINGKIDKSSIDILDEHPLVEDEQRQWTPVELLIRDVVEEVTSIQTLSNTDNFYELGIDSIVSMQICANLQAVDLNVSVSDLFNYQTIQTLAEYLSKKQKEAETVVANEWQKNQLSPIQQWFFDSQLDAPSQWNQSVVLKLAVGISKERVADALKSLIDGYVIFNSVFKNSGGKWQQILLSDSKTDYFIDYFEASDDAAVETIIARQQQQLDINKKNYQFSIITAGSDTIVHLTAHHLIIDGVSWRNLLNRLSGKLKGQVESVQGKTFNQWVDYLDTYQVTEHSQRYWSGFKETEEMGHLVLVKELKEAIVTFTERDTTLLKKIIQEKFFGDMEAALLGMAVHSLSEVYSTRKNFTVKMEGHGRPVDEAGFSTTIGWFTSMYPLIISKEKEVDQTIAKLHKQILSIPNKGLDYQLLNSLSFSSDWTFNYMGEFHSKAYQNFDILSLFRTDDFGEDTKAIYDLSFVPIITEGALEIRVSYNSEKYDTAHVQKILAAYEVLIKTFLEQQHLLYLPACAMQKGMLLQNIQSPKSGDYVIQWKIFTEQLDFNQLQQSITKLIASSEALRSSFMMIEGEAIQIVRSTKELLARNCIQLLDWSDVSSNEKTEKVSEFLENQRCIPFDIIEGPLFRFHVIKMNHGYTLIFEHHHLILDGWSMTHLFNRLSQIYENPLIKLELDDRYSSLKKNIETEKKYLNLENWQNVLADYSEIELFEIGAVGKSNEVIQKTIDDLHGINEFLRKNKLTMNQFFLLGWTLTLSQFFGKEDVLFGVTTSGRSSFKKQDMDTIGMFISTLPFRIRKLNGVSEMEELIDQVRKNTAMIQEYDRISWLDISEYFAESPEIQIGYVFENYPVHSNPGKFSMDKFEGKEQVEFPLALSITAGKNQIDYELHVSSAYFNEGIIETIIVLFEQTIQLLQEDQLSYSEMSDKLYRNQDIYPQMKTLTVSDKQLSNELKGHFDTYSKQTFIHTSKRVLTYGETKTIAEQLVQKTGISASDIVVVMTEDRLKKTIYALACFISGAVYVPVSTEFNEERIRYIIKDSSATCIFTETGEFMRLVSAAKENKIAYILYTSGTTGKPKGVKVTKINIQNEIESLLDCHLLKNTDILYQNISMTFDPSITDILLPLYTGAAIYIPENRFYGEEMEQVLREKNITAVTTTPSLVKVLNLKDIPSLKTIMIGGERLRYSDVQHIPKHITLYNLYGPTETTILASLFKIDFETRTRMKVYPIGQTINKLNRYILSKDGKKMPFGMLGELVLEGPTISMGYTDKSLTNKVFDYHESCLDKNRYFTGDSCYISKDQLIHFIGRKDRQVKLRGYRVELNEIEQSIEKISGVTNFQLLLNDEATLLSLAYIGEISEDQVRQAMKKVVPSYMIPSVIKKMARFPLRANGKIDPRILAKILKDGSVEVVENTKSESPLVKTVLGIWQETLKLSSISKEDNFFDLGGNSLTAIQVIRKINEKIDGTITIQKLFEAKNFAAFIEYIEEENR